MESLNEKLKQVNNNLLTLINDYNYLIEYDSEKYDRSSMHIYEHSIEYYLKQIRKINKKLEKVNIIEED